MAIHLKHLPSGIKQSQLTVLTSGIGTSYQKYNVAPKEQRTYKGILFASRGEMWRYIELEQKLKKKEIWELKRQPKFILYPAYKDHKPIIYVADFIYYDLIKGTHVVEEFKGYETKEYKIKAHLFERLFPQYEFRVTR